MRPLGGRWLWSGGRGCQPALVGGCCCPEEAGKLAGARDDDHVVRLAAGAHAVVDAMQALLGAISDLQDMVGLTLLAVAEVHPDPRGTRVVPGRLDQ